MPENQTISIESAISRLNFPEVEKLLMEGQRKFSGLNLDGLRLNELPMNFFAVDFSGTSCANTDFSGKNFTKTSFAGADLSGANFTGTTFDDTVLDEAIIHGAAFCDAVAKEYGSEENTIEELFSRCIVSSSTRLPQVHFSALDQETKHWILTARKDPNETCRILIQEYLKENSGIFKFFSTEGRYRSLVALYAHTNPNGTFDEFLEYLNSKMITFPPNHPIDKRMQFVNHWYDLGRDDLISRLLPPTAEAGGIGQIKAQPPLYSMIACELWRIFVNQVKDWFTPEAVEPNEED